MRWDRGKRYSLFSLLQAVLQFIFEANFEAENQILASRSWATYTTQLQTAGCAFEVDIRSYKDTIAIQTQLIHHWSIHCKKTYQIHGSPVWTESHILWPTLVSCVKGGCDADAMIFDLCNAGQSSFSQMWGAVGSASDAFEKGVRAAQYQHGLSSSRRSRISRMPRRDSQGVLRSYQLGKLVCLQVSLSLAAWNVWKAHWLYYVETWWNCSQSRLWAWMSCLPELCCPAHQDSCWSWPCDSNYLQIACEQFDGTLANL